MSVTTNPTIAGGNSSGGGGATSYGQLTDATTVDLGTVNTPLAAELAGKVPLYSPVTITGSNSLTHSANFNRQLKIVDSGNTTQTLAVDATSGAVAGDYAEIDNTGSGTVTVAGDGTSQVLVGTGFTATIAPNTAGSFLYMGSNVWLSATPAAVAGTAPSQLAMLESGYGLGIASEGSSTFSLLGQGTPTALDSSTTAAGSIAVGSTGWKYRPRVTYSSTAASPHTAGANVASGNMELADATLMNGRFPAKVLFGVSDALSACRIFVGIANVSWSTQLNSGEPSAITTGAMLGIGLDSTDTNLQLMFGPVGSAKTKIDLGSSFQPTQYTAYLLSMDKNGAGTSFSITLENLSSGAVYTKTLTSSDGSLPTGTAFNVTWQRANTTGTTSATLDIGGWTLGRIA